ncbi:sensor domain-containing diguanylate cyclase, partial [Aliivibrio kagoshimensis]|uniref:sensor domain-containing diguanylate cyclase n=1 Tax=Aliivibrio kagoshimensis TaxID=2910230 RepID=UPI003D14A443
VMSEGIKMRVLSDIETFLQFLGDAVLVTDKNSNIIFANTPCLELFGYTQSQFETLSVSDLVCPDVKMHHGDKVKSYIDKKSHPKVMMSRNVMPCVDSAGDRFHARISIATMTINNEACGIAIIQDYSLVHDKMEELESDANTDNLTGAHNQRYLEEVVNGLYRSIWPSQSVGMIFFDLNKFKPINDTYGHDAGDYILKKITERLESKLRTTDLLFRVGGDEFIILFKVSNQGHYQSVLKSIAIKISKIISRPIFIPGNDLFLNVNASIGVGIYPNDTEQMQELISLTDKAMYESKFRGATFYLVSDL